MENSYNTPVQNKYVSLDEFKQYSGYDLEQMLGEGAIPFVNRTEIRLEAFLEARLFQKVSQLYPTFSDYQKVCYKYAIMEQMIYIIVNGDISVDAGYDIDSLKLINNEQKLKKVIAPNAIDQLMNCGLWTLKMRNYGRDNLFPLGWFK